ncbi:Rust resistance kinase Lr10 [Vitis vinifera]|uniref:Rust resistance kinase Lr10 n=1 Tax=Vitis vinifera TaxID=29760 RepID=A0A438G7C6_VITVI|nr:Rust resistance kinase Lr10 [Vitis vinifera]
MTNNFENKLGQGGFASVYKGKLRSGRIVAVKILTMSKAKEQDFINEVATIGRIRHVNVGEDIEIGDAKKDDTKYMKKMVIVALWCVQMKPTDRPCMRKALEMLEGEVKLLQMPPKPTLYSHEMSPEDRENSPIGVPFSSCNGNITISLDGRKQRLGGGAKGREILFASFIRRTKEEFFMGLRETQILSIWLFR